MKTHKNRPGMRRLLAFALVLAMLLTIMPTAAFAKPGPKANGKAGSVFSGLFQSALAQPKAEPAPAAEPEPPAEEPEAPVEAPVEEPAAEEPAEEPVEAPAAPTEEPEAPAPEPEAPAAEPAPEAPAEELSPAIVQELKVGKLTVSIDAEPGAFPEGTKVKAKKADLKDVQKSVDDAEDVSGKVLVAVDITFTLKGEELQPAEGKSVKVSISAPELKDKAKKAAVVHIDDETKKPELVEEVKAPKTDEVSFDADSFSIYAIFEPPYDGPTARIAVNFYGYDGVEGGELKYKKIQTFWVKNSDDAAQIAMNVIDPGIGDLGDMKDKIVFRGWSLDDILDAEGNKYEDSADYVGSAYDTKFDAMSIEDVRNYLKDLEIHEGDELNVYAVLYEFYHVTYFGDYDEELGDANVSLGKQTVFRLVGHDEAPYEINMGFSSVETNRNFKGWKPIVGGDKITPPLSETKEFYENGEDVEITGDVTFVAEAPYGVWLVYHANGKGATYNAPQFYEGSDGNWPTTTPAENATADKMVRKGYDFVGWYYSKTAEGSDELVIDEDRPFTFGGDITEDTDIFAKWVPKTKAPYTVVCYIQRLDDPAKYDIADTQVFNAEDTTAKVDDPIPYTAVENGNEDYATGVGTKVVDGETVQKGHYTGFCLRDDCKELEVPITADGEAVLELYYDRITFNLRFYLYRQPGSVQTTTQRLPFTGTATQNSGTYYGTYDDGATWFRVYWRNAGGGMWRTRNSNNQGDQYTGTVYSDQTVVVEGSFTPTEGVYDYANNSAAGTDEDSIVSWHSNQTTHPTLSAEYAEEHPLKYADLTFGDSTYRYYYFEITAKYGEDISSQWPRYDIDIIGVETNNRVPVSYVMMVGTALKQNPTSDGSGTVKGVISVLNENILGATNDEDGNYVIVRFPGGTIYNWRYHIWFEAVDGKDIEGNELDPDDLRQNGDKYYYEDHVVVVRSSNTQVGSQNDPVYESFDFQEKKGENWNGTAQYWNTTEEGTTLYNLSYLYDRQMYMVSYNDGQYVDGNGNALVNKANRFLKDSEEVSVGSDISALADYDPSADNEPGPSEPGFVFEGWYIDETCEHPYDFDVMPLGGIRVFAKWVQIQYRVFMHPNATVKDSEGHDVDDTNLSWGDETLGADEKQAMCFRISYGGTVSTPTGTRTGYIFRGWYTDPGLNQVYSSKTELNEITVKTAYDKANDMTDIMDKFGNIVDNGAQYWVSNELLTANKAPYNSDDDDHNARWWITKKLDLYARWQKILEGAQGVLVDYDAVEGKGTFAGGETLYHDPLPYEDNSNAVAASAPTPSDPTQQFLYWVVQQWNGTEYEDAKDADGQLITTYPGDDIRVLASYTRITETDSDVTVNPADVQDNHEYVYTMRVRAEYGPIEIPKDTYFNWYRNYQVDQGKTDAADIAAATIYQNVDLQINESVEIFALTSGTVPSRPGYIFKGWARESEFVEANPPLDENGKPVGTVVLYYENPSLYLKWVTETRADPEPHYEAYNTKTGAWEKVTEVAADEFTPYQAFYAVWEKRDTFTVVYSHDMDTEYTFYCDEAPATINLVAGTAGLTDIEGSAVTLGVSNGMLYAGYYTAAPVSGKWDVTAACTADGRTLAPQPNTTYYVKEVDASYLSGYFTYSYVGTANPYKNQCTSMVVLSSIDDLNYSGVGFVLDQGGTYTNKTSGVKKSLRFQPAGKTPVTINASSAFGHAGYLTYFDVSTILDFDSLAEATYDENNELTGVTFSSATFQIYPYWVTLDGVPVVGTGSTVVVHVLENGVLVRPANRQNIQESVPAGVMAVLAPSAG